MSRSSILIVLGILSILAPFSGLPSALRTLLAIVLGGAVLGIALSDRVREQHRLISESRATPHTPHAEGSATISAI